MINEFFYVFGPASFIANIILLKMFLNERKHHDDYVKKQKQIEDNLNSQLLILLGSKR